VKLQLRRAFLILMSLGLVSASAQASSFEQLPVSPGLGADGPHVSDDGQVLVWTGSGFVVHYRPTAAVGAAGTPIPDLTGGGTRMWAHAVNQDGSVIVGSGVGFVSSGGEAFVWTPAGGTVRLGDLGEVHSENVAQDVSYDGSIIVGWSRCIPSAECPSGVLAFVWDAVDGMQSIPVDRSQVVVSGNATAPNFLGAIAGGGGFNPPTVRRMAVGGVTSVDLQFDGEPHASSRDGTVLVGHAVIDSDGQAFRWSCGDGASCSLGNGTLEALGGVEAWDVTANGEVVVGTTHPIDGAVLWDRDGTPHDLSDMLVNDYGLDLGGCRLDVATGVSANGKVIVGYGDCPGIGRDAWVAQLDTPPFPIQLPSAKPAGLFALALGLVAIALARIK
jgi:hypothetical protein